MALAFHGNKGGLKTQDALKRCKTDGGVMNGVLGILCPWKKMGPVSLVVCAKGSRKSADLLVHALYLITCLLVVA